MQSLEVSVGKQGRMVIPSVLRQQLAIEPGSQLIAWVEGDRLIMETKQQLWQAIHQACENIPAEIDLAEELIQERRDAAKFEAV